MVAEHGLGGGAEGQALFQLLTAAHGDPGNFRSKAIDKLPFLLQKALRDQNGHRNIDMAGFLKLGVHDILHVFPDGIAIGAQNGKTLDRGILDELCLAADIGIPLGKIGFHIGDLFYFFLFRHGVLRSYSSDCDPNQNI